MKTASIILLIALGLVASSYAKGAKTFGDTCSFITSGIQLFSDSNFAEACDTDKNLICALNKCDCVPGYKWEQNIFGQVLGYGGACERELQGSSSASGVKVFFSGIFATVLSTFVLRQVIY